jgi:phage-related protein
MVSQHIIKIILKAEDQISSAMKKADQTVKQLGTTSKTSMNTANQAMNSFKNSTNNVNNPLQKLQNTLKSTGIAGRSSFENLVSSQKQVLTSFQSTSKVTEELKQKLQSLGGATEITQRLSQTFDTVKNKAITFGNTVKTSIGGSFDSVKSKITGFASNVRSSFAGIKSSISSSIASMKELSASSRTAGGGLSFLRNAASMTVGMIGYDLVNSMIQSARESINAAGNFTNFGKRLGMTKSEIDTFRGACDNMQASFRKVDMNAVGASAMELGVKLGIPKTQMGELTKMTAVMSSAFVREGRTQEDAILAVSDAMDGQFRRLQEIGISQEMLKNNGWNGNLQDTNSLMQAMNKTLDEMGFTETAQGIYTLDDAYAALSVSLGRLVADILIPITPLITGVVDAITNGLSMIKNAWNSLPDWAQAAIIIGAIAVALGLLIGSLGGVGGALFALEGILVPVIGLITSISLPVVAAVAAIGLLVLAIYEIGKAFGWWKDVGSMVNAISSGIQRLWSAFINNPDVQGLIKGISDAFTWLCDVIKPVTNAFSNVFPESATGEFDIVRAIIDTVSYSFNVLKGVLIAITIPAQAVIEVFTQIIEILSPVLIPVLELVGQVLIEMVSGLIQIIDLFAQFGEGQITLSDLLIGIWNVLLETFTNILITIATTIAGWIIQIATMALQAGMNFVMGILSWISQLPGRIGNYILQTLTRIIVGMAQWVANARNKASSMVSAVVSFISRLPGRVYGFIVNTATRIANGASQWVANARSKASQVVSAVISHISQLPGKVYNEFMNIGSRILSAGSDLVNKARQIGKNIVDSMLGAMGIHSPGIIQNKVTAEFENTLDNVANLTSKAENVGAAVGEGLVSSYSDFKLPEQTLTANVQTNTDTSNNNEDSQEEVDNQNNTLNSMVANVNDKYNQMKSLAGIDLSQLQLMNTQAFTNIRANEMAQMNMMTNHINTSLLNILNYTQNGLLQAYNITRENLSKMQNSTTRITKEMVKAWNSMKNSIVSAAKNIKKEASSYFNQLGSTIGGFYRKLQNPNLWGAGPNNTGMMQRNRVVGRASSGGSSSGMSVMSRILASSIRREKHIPEYISTVQAQTIPCITPGIIEYNANNGRINTTELIRGGVVSPDCLPTNSRSGAGPWENTVYPNVRKIKDTVNTWSMKGPSIHTGAGNVDTGLAFKVRDFATGTPNISFDSFKQMAQAIFRTVPYDHYSDSEKYGSWQNAIAAGRCNCSDGADALLALANTCGFSGEKVHCYWDGEGHFCTRINGQIMDTTAMQQRGTWISSAVTGYGSGPAPKRVGRQTVARSSGFTESENENNGLNGDFMLGGEITVKHEFENLPENVDEATIVQMIQETTNSDSWIKNLANNIRFQVADAKAKTKIERRQNRSRGNIA